MFCWDVNQHIVVSTLDCANIIPAVDSHKINKHKRFEGKKCCSKAQNTNTMYMYIKMGVTVA